MEKPELLAPAGGWDAFVAAVENGADAVYLGGKLFSARQYASNFDIDELSKAVRYAHIRGVKVFVTVNTLIDDSELPEAADFLRQLGRLGVDAVIIQDLGLIRLARLLIPELELHGSTQMTIHNEEGVRLLWESGLSRIVLAREMELGEISAISQATEAEIEVFIHGALCICYSGQCLMSSLIGGRSGNRGRCAQPCRLEYDLVALDDAGREIQDHPDLRKINFGSGYLLSPKDLNTIELVKELTNAGVDSLKIEGRMKRPEYVATVTRIYRDVLDRLDEPQPEPTDDEKESLIQIFNRGVTTAYLKEDPGRELMSYKRPNNRGKYLGRIEQYDKVGRLATIILDDRLSLGDGIEVWVSQGGRAAAVVRKMTKQGRLVEAAAPGDKVVIEIDGKIRPGDRCFKTRDDELLAKAQESYKSPRALRKIGIDVSVSGNVGLPLEIIIVDEDGNKVRVTTDANLEYAQKRPITLEYIRDQIDRLGNSPFQLHGFHYEVGERLILPVSKVNDARRKAIEELESLRAARNTKPLTYLESDDEFKRRLDSEVMLQTQMSFSKPELVVSVDDIPSGISAISEGADVVGLNMESRKLSMESASIEEFARLVQETDKRVGISLITPRIIKDDELKGIVAAIAEIAPLLKADSIVVRNLGLLQYLRDAGCADLEIGFDYTLGIFNPQALRLLAELADMLRVSFAAVSPELTMEQLKTFSGKSPMKVETLVHGTLTTMVSEHCFICSLAGTGNKKACGRRCENARYGLKDRTGAIFPISGDMGCRGHIANSRDLCMIDHIRDLCRAGINRFRIEGWNKSSDYIRQVTRTYRNEIDRYWEAPASYASDQTLRERLEELSPYGITKGHYFRGVL